MTVNETVQEIQRDLDWVNEQIERLEAQPLTNDRNAILASMESRKLALLDTREQINAGLDEAARQAAKPRPTFTSMKWK